MLFLYGRGDFELLSQALSDYDIDSLFFNVSQVLALRGETEAAGILAAIDFVPIQATNHFNDEFIVLYAEVSLSQYEYLREASTHQDTKQVFKQIATVVSEIGPFIRYIVCELNRSLPSKNWRSDLANSIALLNSNQALFTFKNSEKLVYEGLNFRSKTEIKIFAALIKREVLVFPLPLAVMGKKRNYKEPDFVVCYKSKCGILEIHGDKWHPPETAAKEHERRREFVKLGINIFEIFDAKRCWNDPDGVVENFLQLFEQF